MNNCDIGGKSKDVEITCEVFDKIEDIIKCLENKGFHFVQEFILNDIYMNNTETKKFVPVDGKITDTLIIRYVNENDKKIISKKRNYNEKGIEKGIEKSTDKVVLKIENVEDALKFLNTLGYTEYLRMIDKNYMYENEEYRAYIQEIETLGTFLEIEAKKQNTKIDTLIEYATKLNLKIGTKFDIRKAELLYKSKHNML